MKGFIEIAVCLMLLVSLTLAGIDSQEEELDNKIRVDKDKKDGSDEDAAGFKQELVAVPDECEKKSQEGDVLVVEYTATIPKADNVVFDTTDDRKRPFHFTLGEGRVMRGWEEGLKDMCVGEIRDLTIPPGAYQKGDMGSGALIPHDDDVLVYRFKLLSIRSSPPPINMFKEMDADGNNGIEKEEMLNYLKNEGLGGLQDEQKIEDVIDTIFEGQDRDGDDKISHEEFGGPKHDEF